MRARRRGELQVRVARYERSLRDRSLARAPTPLSEIEIFQPIFVRLSVPCKSAERRKMGKRNSISVSPSTPPPSLTPTQLLSLCVSLPSSLFFPPDAISFVDLGSPICSRETASSALPPISLCSASIFIEKIQLGSQRLQHT